MANFMPVLVFSLCLCLSPALSPLPSLPLSDIKCLVTQGHGYRMLSKQSPLPTLCLVFKTRKWNRTLGKEALLHFRAADCSGQRLWGLLAGPPPADRGWGTDPLCCSNHRQLRGLQEAPARRTHVWNIYSHAQSTLTPELVPGSCRRVCEDQEVSQVGSVTASLCLPCHCLPANQSSAFDLPQPLLFPLERALLLSAFAEA